MINSELVSLVSRLWSGMSQCSYCARLCMADRTKGPTGFCKSAMDFNIASVCLHTGEEPVLGGGRGVCNVFWGHCNLQCAYCQNHQISNNRSAAKLMDVEQAVQAIIKILDGGCNTLGFVSPSHFVPQMMEIIKRLNNAGHKPTTIYNSNGYDNPETLRLLEDYIDVYLPDFKYADPILAHKYSLAADYVPKAQAALKEMYRQKGTSLITDENDCAVSGLIIRHLVLPGAVQNSIDALRWIADNLSPRVHLSLMSQYYPTPHTHLPTPLNRTLHREEYEVVCAEAETLGFTRGWQQKFESSDFYRPNFDYDHPFE